MKPAEKIGMGRKKTPPPITTLNIGDRVKIAASHNFGGLTGIIESAKLQGRGGSHQYWVYQVKTLEKFPNKHSYTKTRLSIRAYQQSLIVLKKASPLK